MATIEKNEVGFAMGEYTTAICLAEDIKVVPDFDSTGKIKPTGKIHITISYENAAVKDSGYPPARLYSICNKEGSDGAAFNVITDCKVKFCFDSSKMVTFDDENAPKELSIVIQGEGPKKNSFTS